MSEEGGGKTRGATAAADAGNSSRPPLPSNYYGTFQGVANYQPQPPPHSHLVMGFPQPAPPPGFPVPTPHYPTPQYYPQGYQTVPGYAVYDGRRPFREERLPCCGVGIGWFLFITGFIMGAIPWYIGAFLLLCVRLDHREKPGLIACVVGALLAALAVTLGATKATHAW